MRTSQALTRAWHWLLDKLGGLGLFFLGLFVIPFISFFIAAFPDKPQRWVDGIILFAFSIGVARMGRREAIKKEQAQTRRQAARAFITRLRELPMTQRHVRDPDLDLLEAGLQEPPT